MKPLCKDQVCFTSKVPDNEEKSFIGIFGPPKVNKKVLEALVKSGSLDCFDRPRRQLMETIDKAMSQAQALQRDRNAGQTNMFDMFQTSQASAVEEEYVMVGEFPQKDKLNFEREAIGFYCFRK